MIRSRIRENKKYLRFKDAFNKNPNNVIDFDSLHEEMERLHKTRHVRSLRRKSKGFAEDLLDSLIQDQRVRSRCTEILGVCITVAGAMKETLDNLSDYLLIEYTDLLKTLGTVKERQAVVESVLRPFFKYLDQIEQLRAHAKVIIEDIDKAGFAHTNMVAAVQMLSRPERAL
jgi:hypothetical protein